MERTALLKCSPTEDGVLASYSSGIK